MGIFIGMNISKSVTKEEWEKVYDETLVLVENLPFAEIIKKRIHGIDTICLVRSKEVTKDDGNEKKRIGWLTEGDYTYMKTAEDFFLSRNLVDEKDVEADAGDAILGHMPAYLDYGWEDEICSHTYRLWDFKTQGEMYHMYLLAIACLIEARLGDKAFTHGDITRGQCRKAVEMANEYLETPIEMPDACNMDRLAARVSRMPLSETEKIRLFDGIYLGNKGSEYGEFIRKTFQKQYIDEYWRIRLGRYELKMMGLGSAFREYMAQGFDLEEVCGFVKLQSKDGQDEHRYFINRVMDAKLHIKEKNCKDPLAIDKEEEGTYSIWTLFAQIGFAGARNKKVDRYIPVEDIKKALVAGLRQYNDVEQIIDEYLEEEAHKQPAEKDIADTFGQKIDMIAEKLEEKQEKYDVSEPEELKFYERGDTMHPSLEKALGKSRSFLDAIPEEEEFKRLQEEPAQNKCRWLIEHNKYILIRDIDWEKIFTDIENNEESFGRYYSIMRVKTDTSNLVEISIGLMINDDLYAYSKTLAEQLEAEQEEI